MEDGMRKVMVVVLAGGALASASPAQAQGWGVWLGTRPAYGGYVQRGDDDWWARSVCSGQRSHMLEDRLRHEQAEDEIDPDTADHMHDAIDRLEDHARQECGEGDRRGIWNIFQRYNGIERWMENEAHGDERRGW